MSEPGRHKNLDSEAVYKVYVESGYRYNVAADRLGVTAATVKLHAKRWAEPRGLPVGPQPYVPQPESQVRKGPLPATVAAAPTEDDAWLESVKHEIKRRPASLDALAEALKTSRGQALDAIDRLRKAGLNLFERSGVWHWDKTPAPGHTRTDLPEFVSDSEGWFRFGFTSDNHLCSKYSRLDVLNDLYDKFAEAGITTVLNGGNWIDGEARFNVHDLLVHGVNQQLDYLAENWPQRKGVTTYAVAGDDHEGWYAQREGMNIGQMAENAMRKAGRDDWRDLGYMEAYLRLTHARTGKSSMGHLIHAGGGTAYAVSYTTQKIVESYDGGDKPAIVWVGHYHKLVYHIVRNVHAIQAGTTQDQTPFMRKRKIAANVGGGTCEFQLDPATGAIVRCRVEMFPYFVRDYYNNRWDLAGDVTLADRGVA